MNYCDLLFNTEDRYLDNDMIIDLDNNKRYTYRELEENVLKVADFLAARGYKAGSVISTHIYNSAEAAIVLLAVEYIGGVICLIDPLFKADELNYYLDDSASSCLITHLKKEELDINIDTDVLEVKEIEDILVKPISAEAEELEMYNFAEDELAMLLYTSGSTSTPKGVMLTTGCFYTFLEKSNKSMYIYNEDDRLLCFVPFSHAYGSVSLLIPALAGKAAIVFLRSFHPTKVANAIAAENITHIFGVPTHYQQLLRSEDIVKSLRKLKAAFCAAAPLSYNTARNWFDKTGIYLDEGYGMSETTTLIATRMSRLPEPSGNVGYPPEGILEIQAVDENANVAEDGIIGELRVKGDGIMLGYLNRPEETKKVLKDGWIYTGDYGYRRSDGSFVISGRKKEFINVAGLKISPIEIEAALNSHPDVIDSAAIGVSDNLYGELVKAFVVSKNDSESTERDLIRYLSNKLANFKVPREITFLEKLPRNNIGKIDKNALKEIKTA